MDATEPTQTQEIQNDLNEAEQGKQSKNTCSWAIKTVLSFLAVAAALVVAYMAVTYLAGSDFNLDTLLHGKKYSTLP
jgi:hypothetical protein